MEDLSDEEGVMDLELGDEDEEDSDYDSDEDIDAGGSLAKRALTFAFLLSLCAHFARMLTYAHLTYEKQLAMSGKYCTSYRLLPRRR